MQRHYYTSAKIVRDGLEGNNEVKGDRKNTDYHSRSDCVECTSSYVSQRSVEGAVREDNGHQNGCEVQRCT